MGAISAMLLIASMIAAFLCIRKAVPLLAHLRRTLPLAHVDRRLVLEGAKSRSLDQTAGSHPGKSP